ncbi:hypothetical protein B0H16DRAFT_1474404 [Mycena metata]|uniref:Uncharacterized protein n=1 Tax=Mycena metata TaxID=1033252 RepID=A0AAD7HH48_9AGAR|nr:hypothetical protein B0H16DRAFT_1474404 [Mycena metata]
MSSSSFPRFLGCGGCSELAETAAGQNAGRRWPRRWEGGGEVEGSLQETFKCYMGPKGPARTLIEVELNKYIKFKLQKLTLATKKKNGNKIGQGGFSFRLSTVLGVESQFNLGERNEDYEKKAYLAGNRF